MKSVARAFVLFAFMALLTLHVATGFLASFTEKVPRAVTGIDTVIRTGLVSWLGHTNTLALLAFLTLLLPAAVCLRALQAGRSVHPEPVIIKPARMQRMVDRAPKSDLRPQDRQLLANILEGVVGQIAREHEMLKANERPSPFVRLVPQVPIPPDGPPHSWFGGNPSLPEGTSWPIRLRRPSRRPLGRRGATQRLAFLLPRLRERLSCREDSPHPILRRTGGAAFPDRVRVVVAA